MFEFVLDNCEIIIIYEYFSVNDLCCILDYVDSMLVVIYDFINQMSLIMSYSFDMVNLVNWELFEYCDCIYDVKLSYDNVCVDFEYILNDVIIFKGGVIYKDYLYLIVGLCVDGLFVFVDVVDGIVDNVVFGISNVVIFVDGNVVNFGGQLFFMVDNV